MTAAAFDQASAQKLFGEAMDNFNSAMKVGLEAQEDAMNYMVKAMKEAPTLPELQEKLKAAADDATPVVRQNLEQAIEQLNVNAQASMELMQKAVDLVKDGNVEATQAKTQQMVESVLASVRQNTQTVVQMNSRVLDAWAKFATVATPHEG